LTFGRPFSGHGTTAKTLGRTVQETLKPSVCSPGPAALLCFRGFQIVCTRFAYFSHETRLTSLVVALDENPHSAIFRPTWPQPVAGAFVFPQTVRRGPVEKLRTFQKYNVSLEEIEHRANSFSRCGCVRRGAATDANARRTASRQIAFASFVDNTLQTIQWFSHGIFVLRPHFLRHRTA
jgi:hypothetical protein